MPQCRGFLSAELKSYPRGHVSILAPVYAEPADDGLERAGLYTLLVAPPTFLKRGGSGAFAPGGTPRPSSDRAAGFTHLLGVRRCATSANFDVPRPLGREKRLPYNFGLHEPERYVGRRCDEGDQDKITSPYGAILAPGRRGYQCALRRHLHGSRFGGLPDEQDYENEGVSTKPAGSRRGTIDRPSTQCPK